jgi:curved DNA-binding protein
LPFAGKTLSFLSLQMADLYSELGVQKNASSDDIKKAYRKLAAKLHPDRHPGDRKAEARFKDVNRAYQVLSDPKKRRLYDEFGEDGLREGFNPEVMRAYRRGTGNRVRYRRNGTGVNVEDLFTPHEPQGGGGGFSDLFGDLFGSRGRSASRPGMKGADSALPVSVDFVSAIRGTDLKLQAQDGTEVTVRVPPGAGEGDKLRLPGRGSPSVLGGAPGDLVIVIHVDAHPHFRREGLDLHLDLPITVAEAFDGAKVRVPTPDGDVTLTVPQGAQSGQTVRLKSRGVRRKNEQGDLYVRFLIRLPDRSSPEVERAVRVLAEHQSGDLRAGISF